MTTVQVVVDTRVLDDLSTKLSRQIALEIARASRACQSYAQANVPVDTGALKNSIQARPFGVTALPPLKRSRKGRQRKPAPLVHATQIPASDTPMKAFVVVGVNYGMPLERKHNFMARAAQRTEGEFTRNCQKLLEQSR